MTKRSTNPYLIGVASFALTLLAFAPVGSDAKAQPAPRAVTMAS